MGTKSAKDRIRGLWCRAQGLPSYQGLNSELIATWAHAVDLPVDTVEERSIGRFNSIPAVVLTTGDHIAAYPKVAAMGDPAWLLNKQRRDLEASLWSKVEWFLPFWTGHGDSREILAAVSCRDREEAIRHFNYHTSTIYTLPFQAICIAQLMPSCRSLDEFSPVIREAYLAAYSGYSASSIAALIPVIEGALRKMSGSSGDAPVREVVDRVCDRACLSASKLYYDGMWVPEEYTTPDYLFAQDELVFGFQTFREWLKSAFFKNSGEYDGVTWLNRHLFAHGASTLWQEGTNLQRLIVALATLGLIESWHDESHCVPLLFPRMNDDSKLLWQQALLRGAIQGVVTQHEASVYQEHGRLVPELPGDDGRLLRSAHLGDRCINELVRPLRDAGWQVKVGEPDEKGLWMKVEATSGEEHLAIGLLFSCATANQIYRDLASTCSAILYLGAPHQQESFAYGIDVHVGPVAGWRPPAPKGDVTPDL